MWKDFVPPPTNQNVGMQSLVAQPFALVCYTSSKYRIPILTGSICKINGKRNKLNTVISPCSATH